MDILVVVGFGFDTDNDMCCCCCCRDLRGLSLLIDVVVVVAPWPSSSAQMMLLLVGSNCSLQLRLNSPRRSRLGAWPKMCDAGGRFRPSPAVDTCSSARRTSSWWFDLCGELSGDRRCFERGLIAKSLLLVVCKKCKVRESLLAAKMVGHRCNSDVCLYLPCSRAESTIEGTQCLR